MSWKSVMTELMTMPGAGETEAVIAAVDHDDQQPAPMPQVTTQTVARPYPSVSVQTVDAPSAAGP